MIRTLLIIAGASLVLALASIAGAAALGGREFAANGYQWTILDSDGDGVRFERSTGERGPDVARTLQWNGTDTLRLDIPGQVVFTQGSTPSVTVTGSQTAIDRLRLENGRLYMTEGQESVTFDWRNGLHAWSDADSLRIAITAPSVNAFQINGSADLRIVDYDQPRLSLDISGSGEATVHGRTRQASVDVSGSGEADLEGLTTTDADVDIAGSGEVRVGPTGRATIDISGSGDVTLTTRPASVQSNISGSGDIDQL